MESFLALQNIRGRGYAQFSGKKVERQESVTDVKKKLNKATGEGS